MRTRRVADSMGNGAGRLWWKPPGYSRFAETSGQLLPSLFYCSALGLQMASDSSGFALHEDEFHVRFNDGIGFVRLP